MTDTNISEAKHVADIIRKQITNIKLKYKNKNIKITASFVVASLIDNMNYIGKHLCINDLEFLYNIQKPEKSDWECIESKKEKNYK